MTYFKGENAMKLTRKENVVTETFRVVGTCVDLHGYPAGTEIVILDKNC